MVCLQRVLKLAAYSADRHSDQIHLIHGNGCVPHYVASTSDGVCVCVYVCVLCVWVCGVCVWCVCVVCVYVWRRMSYKSDGSLFAKKLE